MDDAFMDDEVTGTAVL